MVWEFVRQWNAQVRRRVRRAFLAEPEKVPQRFAIVMASVLLISIVVTYNVLFERKKRNEGIQPPTVTDLFRARNAQQRLEHLELQRNIIQAKEGTQTTTVNEF